MQNLGTLRQLSLGDLADDGREEERGGGGENNAQFNGHFVELAHALRSDQFSCVYWHCQLLATNWMLQLLLNFMLCPDLVINRHGTLSRCSIIVEIDCHHWQFLPSSPSPCPWDTTHDPLFRLLVSLLLPDIFFLSIYLIRLPGDVAEPPDGVVQGTSRPSF